MRALRAVLLTFAAVVLVGYSCPAVAKAWSPFDGINCNASYANRQSQNSAKNNPVCQSKNKSTTTDPIAGSHGIILRIANFIATIAGVAAVIIILVSGLRFVTSGGSSENVAGARRAIIYALIGLVMIILARSLVALILSRL